MFENVLVSVSIYKTLGVVDEADHDVYIMLVIREVANIKCRKN
jgi:hypothetical protein